MRPRQRLSEAAVAEIARTAVRPAGLSRSPEVHNRVDAQSVLEDIPSIVYVTADEIENQQFIEEFRTAQKRSLFRGGKI